MAKTYDIKKLPYWAQEKVRDLRQEIEKLQRQLEILQNISTGGETNVFTVEGLEDKVYLPEHTAVDFQLGDNYRSIVSVRAISVGDDIRQLQVYGNTNISILPRASNLAYVEIRE